MGHFEDQLGASSHDAGGGSLIVMTQSIDGESWLLAERVRVVVIVAFPAAVVGVEDEIPGKEKHSWPDFAARADPVAAQQHRKLRSGW